MKDTRIEQTSDPFKYWRENAAVHPDIYAIAKECMSCPSGSVESERLFSVAGDIFNVKRTMLTGINFEDMVFLSKNLPFLSFDY